MNNEKIDEIIKILDQMNTTISELDLVVEAERYDDSMLIYNLENISGHLSDIKPQFQNIESQLAQLNNSFSKIVPLLEKIANKGENENP